MDKPDTAKTRGLTVYYDGQCALCQAEISYFRVRSEPESIQFTDVSDPDAHMGDDLDRAKALSRFHVRRSDGALVSGPAAFAEMWSRTPGWRWLAGLTRIPIVIWVLEGVYRVFLRARPMLARWIGPRFSSASRIRSVPTSRQ